MTDILNGSSSWLVYRDRLLFWLNTALVGWFFVALSALSLNPATSGLLLLALLLVWPTAKYAPHIWKDQRWWLLALLLYGVFMMTYYLIEGGGDLSRLDRPARFMAMAWVCVYLLRFGFCKQYLWLAVATGTLIGAGHAFYQAFVIGVDRAAVGTHPITFGYLMAALSLLCFFYARYEKTHTVRLVLALCGLVGVLAAFSTGTRGVVMIYAAVLGYLGVRWIGSGGVRWRWLVAAMITLVLVSLASYQWIPQAKRAIQQTYWEVEQIRSGYLDTSFGTRLQMWSVAIYHGSNNPLTGVGHDLDHMRALSEPYVVEKGLNMQALQYHHFHSVYLEAFAKRGLPGVLVFLLLMYAAVKGMRSHYRNAVLIILAVFVVGGLTEAVMNSGRLLYLLIVGVTVFRCLDHFEMQEKQQSSDAVDVRVDHA